MFHYTTMPSPLGELTIASYSDSITSLFFEGKGAKVMQDCYTEANLPELRKARTQLEEYFGGERQFFRLPLHPLGVSLFQARVYEHLTSIPYGHFYTYERFAVAMGCLSTMAKVVRACAENPIPIIIPCHRLTTPHHSGPYSGGHRRKVFLQEHERKVLGLNPQMFAQ